MNRFKLETELGKGSYAVVRLGTDKSTNTKVACKVY